jgi:pyruvate dehydrogenase E2 component (dihydrolipoamide acetyltransferase)
LAHELKMPALSPTMEKGTLARWLVGVGDRVKPGDLLAEIETDKATMEFEAIDEGVVSALLVAGGSENVLVGTVIATLGEAGEAAPAPMSASAAAPVRAAEPALLAAPGAAPAKAAAVNATPLVRRIADARHIALDRIRGSGARGKIVKADLGLPAVPTVPAPAPATAPVAIIHAPPVGVPVETVKLSGMRKTIARRLTEAKQTVPHFYLTARCQLDALLKLRGEINHSLAARGIKLSVNDLLIKAMAIAMAQVPDVNVQFGGDELHRFGRVDIAMAVAIDGGLVTPVIRDVGALSLSAIARQSQALAEQARAGKLKPEDYQGGTASISNLGMFGIDEMIPVINPPQALILGIGAGVEQPWQVDGQIGLATILAATASFDHRAIDGAAAARFMAALRQLIETPLLLVS